MSEFNDETICALATPQGSGAIAVIRLSGSNAIQITDKIFKGKKSLYEYKPYTIAFGNIIAPSALTKTTSELVAPSNQVVDEVLISIFKAPHSYTGEDSVEISCHGSQFIIQRIMELLIDAGARSAMAGEFTQRAYLNGKMDLAQAEAVADLISSETAGAHRIALAQMKGGFSDELKIMRESLVNLVSLMELELDFSEEDVEFADRTKLRELLDRVSAHIRHLRESFKLGNVIKNGVPVAIVGATNTGKSTLLNALVGEERAIVSDIHGTTRDSIEDTVNLGGVTFRFIDTAGIRNTTETIEMIGIERTFHKMSKASIIMLVLDAQRPEFIREALESFAFKLESTRVGEDEERGVIILINKVDMAFGDGAGAASASDISALVGEIASQATFAKLSPLAILPISAKKNEGLDELRNVLITSQNNLGVLGLGATCGADTSAGSAVLVSNLRHYEALSAAQEHLDRVYAALDANLSTDLLTQDIRAALYEIGSITGEISTDEILGWIFGKFCIGK